MKTVYSPHHRRRCAATELSGGHLVAPYDTPERAENVLAEVRRRFPRAPVVEPTEFGLAPILRVHSSDYVDFLSTCWAEWTAAGHRGEAIPMIWPSRAMPAARPPRDVVGRLGYYALAAETSVTEGTYDAARAAANVALTAQAAVQGGQSAAFALCRPPGHHAATDMFGGYCFLNNAAIAAQAFRDAGTAKVAVLDVDFHHGNGTQEIFYDRSDVFCASLHGAPEDTFPYFLGAASETGIGDGEGYNANYPLPPGTAYDRWREALDDALGRIRTFSPEALVVSLGVDTFEADPISTFRLTRDDFLDYGGRIRRLHLPTVFVMEGGYALDDIGRNVANVLEGFENG